LAGTDLLKETMGQESGKRKGKCGGSDKDSRQFERERIRNGVCCRELIIRARLREKTFHI